MSQLRVTVPEEQIQLGIQNSNHSALALSKGRKRLSSWSRSALSVPRRSRRLSGHIASEQVISSPDWIHAFFDFPYLVLQIRSFLGQPIGFGMTLTPCCRGTFIFFAGRTARTERLSQPTHEVLVQTHHHEVLGFASPSPGPGTN